MLWCLRDPSPETKKWIFEFCTKFGFRNQLQTFWPRCFVKSELSLGLIRYILTIHNLCRMLLNSRFQIATVPCKFCKVFNIFVRKFIWGVMRL